MIQAKLAIDPSINNLGLAWVTEAGQWETDLVEGDKSLPSGKDRMMFMLDEVRRVIRNNNLQIQEVILEYPTFQGSQKGRIAAQQGYTIDLAFICGLIVGALEMHHVTTHLYTPQQWKGQKPKKATEAAARRVFGDVDELSEHEVDALMLLYYHETN